MARPQDSTAIARIRAFNRFYTRKIGLLGESFQGSGLTLPEARVLYELAQGQTTATALRQALAMDRGYLSRILKGFQRRGLVRRTKDRRDARSSILALSGRGLMKFARLESETRAGLRSLLQGVRKEALPQLLDAMALIERGFAKPADDAPAGDEVSLRDLRPGDIGWIAHRQGLLYAAEYGWDMGYEALVAKILGAFQANFDAARERAWIAEYRGQVVASVFLVRENEETARLRLLYVEPFMRGSGLGRRLVRQCTEFSREASYRKIVLWTQSNLAAARALYAAEGYELRKAEAHHSFGADLIGETWELVL